MAYPHNPQYAFDMLMCMGECQQNMAAAERLYHNRYPDRPVFSRRSCATLKKRVLNNEVLPSHNKGKQIKRPIRTEENVINLRAAVNVNPQVSVRDLVRDSSVSIGSVHRILSSSKLHPYHISLHQELSQQDKIQRVTFCEWASEKVEENQHFFENVLWCDEATFKSNGQLNLHNCHYWSDENPHWMRQVDHQNVWSLNVWCGVLGERIIGPFFFEGTLTGEKYLDFLRDSFSELLEEVPLDIRRRMWFQQDGAPPHYARTVRAFLNQMFPRRWMGRGGPYAYPARSPDLTPLDFYLWGKIKDLAYQSRPTTIEDMKQRIFEICRNISVSELRRVQREFNKRVRKCIEAQGGIFEHLE